MNTSGPGLYAAFKNNYGEQLQYQGFFGVPWLTDNSSFVAKVSAVLLLNVVSCSLLSRTTLLTQPLVARSQVWHKNHLGTLFALSTNPSLLEGGVFPCWFNRVHW